MQKRSEKIVRGFERPLGGWRIGVADPSTQLGVGGEQAAEADQL